MKAWLLDDLTGIQNLRLADVPPPVPKTGEAILEVHYAALNPADRYLAERQYPARPSLPHILGRDGIGTVLETGDATSRPGPGDRCIILRSDIGGERPGTFAQRVAVPTESLVEVPPGWGEPEAAGAALVYLTAWQALTMWGPLPESSVVLVTGASGGVGVAAVQLASALGRRTVALSRSAEKSKRLRELGAAATYNPADPRWREALKAALAPCRVNLAIDNIGGKLLPEVMNTLGNLGKASLVGRLAGRSPTSIPPPCSSAASAWAAWPWALIAMPRPFPPGATLCACFPEPAPVPRWTASGLSTNSREPSSAWPRGRWAKSSCKSKGNGPRRRLRSEISLEILEPLLDRSSPC